MQRAPYASISVNRPRPAIQCLMLAGALLLAGCESVQPWLASVSKPSAQIEGVQFQSMDLSAADLQFDVAVTNPYGVPLPISNIEYSLASQGKEFLSGKAESGGSIPAKATKTLSVPVRVSFAELMSSLEQVRLGAVVPYEAELVMTAQVPRAGDIRLPLRHQGEVPIPTVPEVSLGALEWTELSWRKAAAELSMRIRNTNQFPVDLQQFGFGFGLGGKEIASAEISQGPRLAPGGSGEFQIPISFSPSQLGLAALNSLRSGTSSYNISGKMRLGTPFGLPLSMPIERSGELQLRSN